MDERIYQGRLRKGAVDFDRRLTQAIDAVKASGVPMHWRAVASRILADTDMPEGMDESFRVAAILGIRMKVREHMKMLRENSA